MDTDFIPIGQAAKILGVSIQTLRNWEKSGKLQPDFISARNARLYSKHRLHSIAELILPKSSADGKVTIAYARVSANEQKEELNQQVELLEFFCSTEGLPYEIITDIGSGVDCKTKGLRKLLDALLSNKVDRLILTRKDRLLRLAAELVFSICETKGVEVIILNKGQETPETEEKLTGDIREIITVLSLKLNSSGNRKDQALLKKLTYMEKALL